MKQQTFLSLERAGLIRVATGAAEVDYTIHHSLIQEVAYRSLLREERRSLHLTVAEVLERIFSGRREKVSSELAEHFWQAEDYERAFHYHLMAGDQAMRVYAHEEALNHYDRALEAADQDRLEDEQWGAYLSRGRALELSGNHPQALENYEEMELKAQQAGRENQELRARLQTAVLYCTPSPVMDPGTGIQIARQTLERARELNDVEAEARSEWLHLLVFQFTLDRIEEATAAGERALTLTEGEQLSELRGYILNDLGSAYSMMGHVRRSGEVLDEARKLMEVLDNMPMLANVLANQMIHHAIAGEFDRALELSDEGYEISEKIGNLWGQACSLMYIDLVHAELGDFKSALEAGAQCIRIGGASGFAVPSLVANATQAWIKTQLGMLEEASAHVQEDAIETTGLLGTIAGISLSVLALTRLNADDLEGAKRTLRKANETIPPEPDSILHPAVLFTRFAEASLFGAIGNFAELHQIASGTLEEMKQHEFRLLRSDFLVLQAQAYIRDEKPGQAMECLEEGIAFAEEIHSVRTLWKLLAHRARVLAAQGEEKLAAKERTRARSIVDQIAEGIAPLGLDKTFLSQPAVQEVGRAP